MVSGICCVAPHPYWFFQIDSRSESGHSVRDTITNAMSDTRGHRRCRTFAQFRRRSTEAQVVGLWHLLLYAEFGQNVLSLLGQHRAEIRQIIGHIVFGNKLLSSGQRPIFVAGKLRHTTHCKLRRHTKTSVSNSATAELPRVMRSRIFHASCSFIPKTHEPSAESNFEVPSISRGRCLDTMSWPLSSCPRTTIHKYSFLHSPIADLFLHFSTPSNLGQPCVKKPCASAGSAVSVFRSGIKVSSSSRPVVSPWPLPSCMYTTIHKSPRQIICSVTSAILFLKITKSCKHANQALKRSLSLMFLSLAQGLQTYTRKLLVFRVATLQVTSLLVVPTSDATTENEQHSGNQLYAAMVTTYDYLSWIVVLSQDSFRKIYGND